jgi:hypothetical protein
MTDDVVTALWRIAEDCQCDCWICETAAKGANEIEQLRIAGQALVAVIEKDPRLLLLDSVDSALRAWEKVNQIGTN